MRTNWHKTHYHAYAPKFLNMHVERLKSTGYKAKIFKESFDYYVIYACDIWKSDHQVEIVKAEIIKLQTTRRELLEKTAVELRAIEEELTMKQTELERSMLGHSLNKQKGV